MGHPTKIFPEENKAVVLFAIFSSENLELFQLIKDSKIEFSTETIELTFHKYFQIFFKSKNDLILFKLKFSNILTFYDIHLPYFDINKKDFV